MFDMNGMLGFGFGNFEEVRRFMQELTEWREVKQDPEKAAEFLRRASPLFKRGMFNSIHEGFMQAADLLMSSLRTATLLGIPEHLVTQMETYLNEVHTWVDDAGEGLTNTPEEKSAPTPTLSPEEDSAARSILHNVFGEGWV